MLLGILLAVASAGEVTLCIRESSTLGACSARAREVKNPEIIVESLRNVTTTRVVVEVVNTDADPLRLDIGKIMKVMDVGKSLVIRGIVQDATLVLNNKDNVITGRGSFNLSNIRCIYERWEFGKMKLFMSNVRLNDNTRIMADLVTVDSPTFDFMNQVDCNSFILNVTSRIDTKSFIANASSVTLHMEQNVVMKMNSDMNLVFSDLLQLHLNQTRTNKLQINIANGLLNVQSGFFAPESFMVWIDAKGTSEVVINSVIPGLSVVLSDHSKMALNDDCPGEIYIMGNSQTNNEPRKLVIGKQNATIGRLQLTTDSASRYKKTMAQIMVAIEGTNDLRIGKLESHVSTVLTAEKSVCITCNEITCLKDVKMNHFVNVTCLSKFTFEGGFQTCSDTECFETEYVFDKITFTDETSLAYKISRKGIAPLVFGAMYGSPVNIVTVVGTGPQLMFADSHIGVNLSLFKCDSFDFSQCELVFACTGTPNIMNEYVFQRVPDVHSITVVANESPYLAMTRICVHNGHPDLCPHSKYPRVMDASTGDMTSSVTLGSLLKRGTLRSIICTENMSLDLPELVYSAGTRNQLPIFEGATDGIRVVFTNRSMRAVPKVKVSNLVVQFDVRTIDEVTIGRQTSIVPVPTFTCNKILYDVFERNSTEIPKSMTKSSARLLFIDPEVIMLLGSNGMDVSKGSQTIHLVPNRDVPVVIMQTTTYNTNTVKIDCAANAYSPVPAGLSIISERVHFVIPAKFQNKKIVRLSVVSPAVYITTSSNHIPMVFTDANMITLTGADDLDVATTVTIPSIDLSGKNLKIDNEIRNKDNTFTVPVVVQYLTCRGTSAINRDSITLDGPVVINDLSVKSKSEVIVGSKVVLTGVITIANNGLLRSMNEFDSSSEIHIKYNVESNSSAISANQELPYRLPRKVLVIPENVDELTANGTHSVVMFPSNDYELINRWYSLMQVNLTQKHDNWNVNFSIVDEVSPFISMNIEILPSQSLLDLFTPKMLLIVGIILGCIMTGIIGYLFVCLCKKCCRKSSKVTIKELDDADDMESVDPDLVQPLNAETNEPTETL